MSWSEVAKQEPIDTDKIRNIEEERDRTSAQREVDPTVVDNIEREKQDSGNKRQP